MKDLSYIEGQRHMLSRVLELLGEEDGELRIRVMALEYQSAPPARGMSDEEILESLRKHGHHGHMPNCSPARTYRVRVYDGFDREWAMVDSKLTLQVAYRLWMSRTNDGANNTCYNDIDYYVIEQD